MPTQWVNNVLSCGRTSKLSLPMRILNQNFNLLISQISLPMSNRTNIIHKHIGSDTLKVEENAIQDECWEERRVCTFLDPTNVYKKKRCWYLHNHWCNTCVKLQLCWPANKRYSTQFTFYMFAGIMESQNLSRRPRWIFPLVLKCLNQIYPFNVIFCHFHA